MTLRVLHLSDPHFGTEQPAVADALVAFAQALRPHALIVSGDLTQRATDEQFDACAAFLARLPAVPRLVIPGNHDLPLYHLTERLFSPYARYRRFLAAVAAPAGEAGGAGDDARFEPVLALPGLTAIGVDTTRRWRQQDGALSAGQIHRVAERLRAAPAGDWRLVVTHHPLAVLREVDLTDRPLGHALARRRWAEAGADLLLSGHVHVPALLPAEGTMRVLSAGTALSSRLAPGFPNSVNVLVQEPGDGAGLPPRRRIERHDHDARRGRFEQAAVEELAA